MNSLGFIRSSELLRLLFKLFAKGLYGNDDFCYLGPLEFIYVDKIDTFGCFSRDSLGLSYPGPKEVFVLAYL